MQNNCFAHYTKISVKFISKYNTKFSVMTIWVIFMNKSLITLVLISILFFAGCASLVGSNNPKIITLKNECESQILQSTQPDFDYYGYFPAGLSHQEWQRPTNDELGYYLTTAVVGKCHQGSLAGEVDGNTYCTGEFYKKVVDKDSRGTIQSNLNYFFTIKTVYGANGSVQGSCTFKQTSDKTYIG